jgi:DNA-binding PucR family transcriptional regulator
VPGNAALGLHDRLCVPIRTSSGVAGYLWLIDTDGSLSDRAIAAADGAARAAGLVIERDRLRTEVLRGQERELVRDLLSELEELRQHAARQLVETGLLVEHQPIVVLVAQVFPPLEQSSGTVRFSIEQALHQTRRGLPARHCLDLTRPDHGVLVVAAPRLTFSRELAKVAADLRQHLTTAVADRERASEGWTALVGIGDLQESPADAILSYQQARHAVRVGHLVSSFGGTISWSQLGIYRMLSHFPIERLTATDLLPELARLLEHREAPTLIPTLECFLDCAGAVKCTANELGLHRASVYYRLRRIEEITGVSLRDGEGRLALHLGLRLAQLAGLHPARSARHAGGPADRARR